MKTTSHVISSLDIAKVLHTNQANACRFELIPLRTVFVLTNIHHLQRKLVGLSIWVLMAKRVDESGVVSFIKGSFEERVTLDGGKFLDEDLAEKEPLQVVLK